MPFAARLFGDYYFEEEINYFHFIAYLWRWQLWANVGSEFSKLISRLISNVNMSWWVLSQKLKIHQNRILTFNLHKSMNIFWSFLTFKGKYLSKGQITTDRVMFIYKIARFSSTASEALLGPLCITNQMPVLVRQDPHFDFYSAHSIITV